MHFVHREYHDLVPSDPDVRDERASRRDDPRNNGGPDFGSYSCMVEGSPDVSRAEAKAFIEDQWARLSDLLLDANPPGEQSERMRRRLRILEAMYLELDK